MISFTLNQIAEYIQADKLTDDIGERSISNIAGIEDAGEGCLTILMDAKYEPAIYRTKATAVIVANSFKPKKEINTILLHVENPRKALTTLLSAYEQYVLPLRSGISTKADIDPSAKIGKEVYIGPFVCIDEDAEIEDYAQIYANTYIGKNVRIGSKTVINAGVNVYQSTQIGDNVLIESGAVIGSAGFGFLPREDGSYEPIPQIGNVIIGSNVYIGSNTTIDRATMGSTQIREGCKLDNLVHVAHNVEIGKNSAFAGQTGLSGSAKIGEGVRMAGQVGISGHIKIADGVSIGSKSGVLRSITTEGDFLLGIPAVPFRDAARQILYTQKLPAMEKRLQALEKQKKEE